MSSNPALNITIKQIRGNSGIDVWAENLCRGINEQNHDCALNLFPGYFQFLPELLKLSGNSPNSDIIHGSTWNGYIFKNEQPLVITEHHVINDPAFNPYRTFPQKIFHRWIYRCERKTLDVADSIICVSQFTKKKLEEVFGYSDSRVIYNGVDTSVFKPTAPEKKFLEISEDTIVLFFAGNLSNRKGGDLLPAIMDTLGDKFLLLLATGNDARQFTGCHNIRNMGHLSLEQLVSTYNQCDIFLTPSRLEGFGLSVAEAMACGKPVVATNVSSLPELVVDGKGGFLCPRDDVQDFAKNIRHLASDDNLRQEMGAFNRKRVEDLFTIEKMTNEYLTLYRSLLL
jgi:glycosyltransferase involved in cell wall biosynthesis